MSFLQRLLQNCASVAQAVHNFIVLLSRDGRQTDDGIETDVFGKKSIQPLGHAAREFMEFIKISCSQHNLSHPILGCIEIDHCSFDSSDEDSDLEDDQINVISSDIFSPKIASQAKEDIISLSDNQSDDEFAVTGHGWF